MTVTGVTSFDEALSALDGALPGVACELDGATAAQLASMVRRFSQFLASAESVRLRLVAAADQAGSHRVVGARDTAAFLADVCGQKLGAARRDADTALLLGARPMVGAALASGALSPPKAAALARLDDEAAAAEEASLVARAARQSVREVEAAVAAANERHRVEPAPVVIAEATIERDAGRARVTLVLPTLDGEAVEAACVAAAADLDLPTDLALGERLGRGAVAVARWYLANRPTRDAPPLRSRDTLYVTVDWQALSSGAGAGVAASGATVTAADVRRMACDAGISRLLTGPGSLICDIGKTSRAIPAGLAAFLAVDDRGCRWPGCTSPGWACEGHHVIHWAGPGETEPDNVVLLCWHHHHLVHAEPGWVLSLVPGERTLRVRRHDQLVGSTSPPGLEHRQHADQQRGQVRRRRGTPGDEPSVTPPLANHPPPGGAALPDAASPPADTVLTLALPLGRSTSASPG